MRHPIGAAAGALALLLIAAMVLGNSVVLPVVVLLMVFAVVQTVVPAPSGVQVRRDVTRSTCWVGDAIEIRTEVDIASGVGSVYFFDPLPPDLVVESGSNLHAVWKWPGVRRYAWSYQLRFPKRGDYELAPTRWGLTPDIKADEDDEAQHSTKVSAVPRLLGVQRLANARAKAVTHPPSADLAAIGVATTDFRELRPYVAGDPIRNINWKATAKRGDNAVPMVNQFEPEGRRAVWLFVDGAAYMQAGTSVSNPLEQALEAASGIAHFYLNRGFTLGAYFFNNQAGMLPPEVGKQQFRKLTEKLVGLSVDEHAPLEGLRTAVQQCQHYLIRLQPQVVVITRLGAFYVRPAEGQASWLPMLATMKRLGIGRRSRRLRAATWLVTVGGHERLEEADVLESSVSRMLRWETLPLMDELRASGVSVLDWDPTEEPFAKALHKHLVMSRLQR